MVARIACLALSLGFLVGCYNVPQPECGFACGPAGACPSDYSCNTAVNRCQLSGTTPSCTPAFTMDAGTDALPDSQDDFTPPMIIPGSQSPSPDATSVPLDLVLRVAFTEDVLGVNDGSFTLEGNGSAVFGVVGYDLATRTATLQPPTLMVNTVYTVRVLDSITDLAGNPLAMPTVWQFSTGGDMTRPFVTLRSPAFNATGVGVGAAIIVDFSEDVTGVSSASFVVATGGTPIAGTVSYASGMRRAEFTKATQLAPNTTYNVSLSSAIVDMAGNPLAAMSWIFTTGPDLQTPVVVTRAPAPGSTGVAVTAQLTATFDEPVMNVSTTTFTLTPLGGSPVAAAVTYAAGTRTARLTPDLQLAPNTSHTATLTTGVSDTSGNTLAPTSWTFTTGADTIGPRLVQTTPANLATAVATSSTITVQFDEPVQNAVFTVNGGAITGTSSGTANTATFTPDAPLPANATISVALAATDASGNALAAPIAFSFTTAP